MFFKGKTNIEVSAVQTPSQSQAHKLQKRFSKMQKKIQHIGLDSSSFTLMAAAAIKA